MNDYCSVVNIIPQYLGTCWFNAILMSCLYSDGASRIFRETILSDNWETSENPLKLALFNIISYINRIKLFPELREEQSRLFQDYLNRIRPEQLLFKLMEYDDELKDKFIKKEGLGYKTKYLPVFLDILEIPYLSVYKDSYGNIKTFKKNGKEFKIILFHINYIPFYEETYIDYDNDIKTLLKGFKLDSILLRNFLNSLNSKGHVITGITCGGERYVYNGLMREDESFRFCNLIPFNWYSNEDFCLNKNKCSLDDIKSKYCFSFKQGERLFVYVKEEEKEEEKLRTKIKDFQLDIRGIKEKYGSIDINSITNISLKPSITQIPLRTDIFTREFTKEFLKSLGDFIYKLYIIFLNFTNRRNYKDSRLDIIDFLNDQNEELYDDEDYNENYDELTDKELIQFYKTNDDEKILNDLLEFFKNKKNRTRFLALLTEEEFKFLNQGHP